MSDTDPSTIIAQLKTKLKVEPHRHIMYEGLQRLFRDSDWVSQVEARGGDNSSLASWYFQGGFETSHDPDDLTDT